MKTTIFNKVREHILAFVSEDDLLNLLNKGHTALELVDDGVFNCYYSQAFETLSEIYWDEFDETRYIKKDWWWKYRDWIPYVWIIYRGIVAMAIDKMARQHA